MIYDSDAHIWVVCLCVCVFAHKLAYSRITLQLLINVCPILDDESRAENGTAQHSTAWHDGGGGGVGALFNCKMLIIIMAPKKLPVCYSICILWQDNKWLAYHRNVPFQIRENLFKQNWNGAERAERRRSRTEQNKNTHTRAPRTHWVGWHLFYLQSFNSEIKLIWSFYFKLCIRLFWISTLCFVGIFLGFMALFVICNFGL